MIQVSSTVTYSPQELRAFAALTPDGGFALTAGMNSFLEGKGKSLVEYVQGKIIDLGAGGKWPALSPAYEKRKSEGKTKGGAKYGSPAILFDSGKSVEGIQAVVDRRTMAIKLMVPDVLSYHFAGAGHLPKRNPVTDDEMAAWNEQFRLDLDMFLSGEVPGAWSSGRTTRAPTAWGSRRTSFQPVRVAG